MREGERTEAERRGGERTGIGRGRWVTGSTEGNVGRVGGWENTKEGYFKGEFLPVANMHV